MWARVTDLIEHLEELGAGLVDGADNGPPPLGQRLHQRDHLETGGTVEATGIERSNNLTSIQKCIPALTTQEANRPTHPSAGAQIKLIIVSDGHEMRRVIQQD